MPRDHVIRDGRVEASAWTFVGLADAPVEAVLPKGAVAVPLAYWKANRDALAARSEPVGVWLAADDDPAALACDLDRLALVAVHFPRFTDGRGYSTAALLRRRYGYRGELRAFGDVGRDQLSYLLRCGFDAFTLAPHRDPHAALAGLEVFSVRYQGSVDDPLPLFRKRGRPQGEAAP